jgi:hypothetical protein
MSHCDSTAHPRRACPTTVVTTVCGQASSPVLGCAPAKCVPVDIAHLLTITTSAPCRQCSDPAAVTPHSPPTHPGDAVAGAAKDAAEDVRHGAKKASIQAGAAAEETKEKGRSWFGRLFRRGKVRGGPREKGRGCWAVGLCDGEGGGMVRWWVAVVFCAESRGCLFFAVWFPAEYPWLLLSGARCPDRSLKRANSPGGAAPPRPRPPPPRPSRCPVVQS